LSSHGNLPKDFEYGIDQLTKNINSKAIPCSVRRNFQKTWVYGDRGTAADFSNREGRNLGGKNGPQERTQNLISWQHGKE
jgi:hypothetical protein